MNFGRERTGALRFGSEREVGLIGCGQPKMENAIRIDWIPIDFGTLRFGSKGEVGLLGDGYERTDCTVGIRRRPIEFDFFFGSRRKGKEWLLRSRCRKMEGAVGVLRIPIEPNLLSAHGGETDENMLLHRLSVGEKCGRIFRSRAHARCRTNVRDYFKKNPAT